MAAAAPALLSAARAQDMAPTTTRLYPGADGKLVYAPDAQGNTIHDASHAGYGGGGVAIPTVAVKETLWPIAGDNTAHLQAAIDRVSALPLDANGFRGALLLRAGYYRMAMPVFLRAGGIVPLQPEVATTPLGPARSLILTVARGKGRANLYDDAGDGLGYEKGQFSRWPVTQEASSRAQVLTIGPARGSFRIEYLMSPLEGGGIQYYEVVH